MPMKRETAYLSFLVRLWHAPEADRDWLVQVEHILSGETHYFSSLEELFAFVRATAEGLEAQDENTAGPHPELDVGD